MRPRRRALRELADQPAGDARGEQRVAGGDDAHGLDQPFGRDVLEQEAARAGAEGVVDVLVEIERREHEHARPARPVARELPGRLDPVHPGHADVHQDHVGAALATDLDSLLSVGGGAHHGEVGLGVEQFGES